MDNDQIEALSRFYMGVGFITTVGSDTTAADL